MSKPAAPALSCNLQGFFRSSSGLGGRRNQETPQPPPSNLALRCRRQPRSAGGKVRATAPQLNDIACHFLAHAAQQQYHRPHPIPRRHATSKLHSPGRRLAASQPAFRRRDEVKSQRWRSHSLHRRCRMRCPACCSRARVPAFAADTCTAFSTGAYLLPESTSRATLRACPTRALKASLCAIARQK